MTDSAPRSLDGADFLLLTTWRRSGKPVATPMWFAAAGDDLLVSTPAGAGKLKRLRHTPRVQVQACSRRGRPEAGAPNLTATARVGGGTDRRTVEAALAAKYGWQWRAALLVERLNARIRRSAPTPRVPIILTLTPVTETEGAPVAQETR